MEKFLLSSEKTNAIKALFRMGFNRIQLDNNILWLIWKPFADEAGIDKTVEEAGRHIHSLVNNIAVYAPLISDDQAKKRKRTANTKE